MSIVKQIKGHRKQLGLTQEQFAKRVGVGLRFLRELEQGKATIRMDKLNQVLDYLGFELTLTKKNSRQLDEQ